MVIFRKILLLFIIELIPSGLFASSWFFEIGSKYHILQYRANVRIEPTRNSEIVAILSLNDAIEIIEESNIVETINGITAYWYKIKYGNITGYTFGGNIAIKTLITDIDNNGINDYFHFRKTLIRINVSPYGREWKFSDINAHTDIIIYINNQRINTNMMYKYSFDSHNRKSFLTRTNEHLFDWCEFIKENNGILTRLQAFGRHDYEWTTVYKIDRNGEINFYEWTEGFHDDKDILRVRLNNNGKMEFEGQFGYFGD